VPVGGVPVGGVPVGGVPVGGAAQAAAVTLSLISVTEPLRASAAPLTVTASFIETDVRARMRPTNCVRVPSVAELPICQKTLHGWAPLMSFTVLSDAVVSAEPT